MNKSEKKITLEYLKRDENNSYRHLKNIVISNPIKETDKIKEMVSKILYEELPRLRNNSLLYNLVLYTVTEKIKTVQTIENVLSYIKKDKVRKVRDISFKNGEIRIKCST